MNYKEVLRYLDSFFNLEKISRYNYSRELKLERMRKLLKEFHNPQNKFSAIHIAGSKGKGTVAVSLYQILKENKYKVGLYTSPHLLTLRERIRFSENRTRDPLGFGDTISEGELIELVKRVKPKIEEFSKNSKWGRPTFFEVYTLLAFLYFEKKEVDFAVLETGLGGRLDATNTCNPILTAITQLLYEHTDKLGNRIEQIAKEKAGIMKRNIPCVVGLQKWENVLEIFREKAKELDVPIFILGENIKVKTRSKVLSINIEGSEYKDFRTNMLAEFQLENVAITLSIIHLLREKGYELKEKRVRKTLFNIYWPGRFQIISREPLVILDSAHTPESIEIVGKELKALYPERNIITILAISRDKDKEGVIEKALDFSEKVILTYLDNPRLSKIDELLSLAKEIGDVRLEVEGNFKRLFVIISSVKREYIFLFTGSIFLVAEALNLWRPIRSMTQ